MFRLLTATILLLAFMAQTFNGAFIIAGYITNTAAYARNCVNKSKPRLHCNGKCQLLKKLRQEEKKDAQNPERNNKQPEQVLSSRSFFAVLPYAPIMQLHQYPAASNAPLSKAARDIFHPPGA